jgi:hypothetical protein
MFLRIAGGSAAVGSVRVTGCFPTVSRIAPPDVEDQAPPAASAGQNGHSMTAAVRQPPRSNRSAWLGRFSGLAAIGSAMSAVAWVAGLGPTGEFPDRWISIWNLLLLPAAGWIGLRLFRRSDLGWRPTVAGLAAVSGLASGLLWATSWQRSDLEPTWIALSAVWWIGTGSLLTGGAGRVLGTFTLVLGIVAGLDAIGTIAGAEGPFLLLTGAKLPLSWLWALIVGAVLVADPMLEGDSA